MVYEEGNVNLRSHAITVGSRSHRPLKLPTDLLTRRDPSTQLPITAGSPCWYLQRMGARTWAQNTWQVGASG